MDDNVKTMLAGLSFTDEQIAKLETEGVTTDEQMAGLSPEQIKAVTDCGIVQANAAHAAFNPPPAAPAGSTSGGEEIPEGAAPTAGQLNDAATQLGMDPSMLSMFLFANMGGGGPDMDMSGLIPIPSVVGGYNPKIRNIPYMVMGQIERRLGTPIVVISDDGSVNAEQTVAYIMSLEEGFDPALDGVHYDEGGTPFEIIKVGVDAQGIYDADPVNPTRALRKNGMGMGRIIWTNVPLEVRQVVFYAATQTSELDPRNDSDLARLRDKIGPETTRLDLRGDYPEAMNAFNQARRSGALPTLRVQLSRGARRPEQMPRRRVRPDRAYVTGDGGR